MKFRLILLYLTFSCSFYSFKGSIPPHIKSVYISPIENSTIEAELSNTIKVDLDESFIRENILKILRLDTSDSQLNVTLTSFTDRPY